MVGTQAETEKVQDGLEASYSRKLKNGQGMTEIQQKHTQTGLKTSH
jgi:hypothetical protein